jgi:serine/threonine protein phosphatase PrpC
MLAVSDGMGGAAAGEVASALVVESLRRSMPPKSADWDATIQKAVERANRAVWNAAKAPERRGMGATLTAVCLDGLDAHVAEVGDSRAYVYRSGVLDLLTHDQSYAQALLDAGALTEQEAARSPLKNVILSAMGTHPDVRVDLGRVTLAAGDRLLVCSDGLSNEVSAKDIGLVLASARSPSEACRELVRRANDHGGRDNITVIVAQLEVSGTPRPPRSSGRHPEGE